MNLSQDLAPGNGEVLTCQYCSAFERHGDAIRVVLKTKERSVVGIATACNLPPKDVEDALMCLPEVFWVQGTNRTLVSVVAQRAAA